MSSVSKSALHAGRGPLARLLTTPASLLAANDNGGGKSTDPAIVEAALRHFAAHGLGAARAARHKAEQAFFNGESNAYRWWHDICHQLDRRMANEAARRLNPPASSDVVNRT